MNPRSRRYARKGFAAFVLFVLACWFVPSFVNAERYRRRLEAGLERALGRHVTFRTVSYRLLPRPGFSIENAVVHEDPAFGFEPFARVERIDCDLRWRSLLHSRLSFGRLFLERPTFNLVRSSNGEWNVESFLLKNGLASPEGSMVGAGASLDSLDLSVDDARIDFTVGTDKKPFALTDLTALVNFNRELGLLSFHLAGNPIRTDLSLPTPGLVEFDGQWTPGRNLEGPLDAMLESRSALLYDWVPLVTGSNPQIYGVFDARIHLTGSLHKVNFDGQCSVSQLHRWEQVPPADPMPATLFFRGQFDRTRGRVMVESLDGTFADSRIHLTGSIDKIPLSPELDLVLAVERSRVEDFLALGRRLSGYLNSIVISGRVDALLSIQGPWRDRHYSGFVGGRGVLLTTPSGPYPVSDVHFRIENRDAHLAPIRILLAPRVELAVEGSIEHSIPSKPSSRNGKSRVLSAEDGPSRYEISLTTKAVPLHNLVSFGRAMGIFSAPGLDARGAASAIFNLTGSAWPFERPVLAGVAELSGASLLVPGLTEPINLPRAHIQVIGDHVTADPVVAVIGTSVFNGRLEHQGDRAQPWQFDVRANTLSLEQGSLWFDVLGRREPIPLLERLPGLSSFGARRVAASNLFGALNARGRFSSPTVTYRALNLVDFKTSVDISERLIRLEGTTFRVGGGRGQGRAVVDLTSAPARTVFDVEMADGNLQALGPHLPTEIRGVRGTYSGTGHFETRGLSHDEMTANLQGSATLRLKNIFLGELDPLQVVAGESGWGTVEPLHGEAGFRSSILIFEVHDRRVLMGSSPLEIAGAKFKVTGAYSFDGTLDLDVGVDMRRITRRWLNAQDESEARTVDLHLAGPLNKLAVVPRREMTQAAPIRRVR